MDKPTLRGELVVLRPIAARDADQMWEMVNDPEGRRLTGTVADITREVNDRWCATVAERDGRVDLAITTHDSDEFVGEIVLLDIDEHDANAAMRMSMRPGYRGRGFGGEAIGLVLEYAFAPAPRGLGLHRVSLDVLEINPRARMLYESHGFEVEGRLREVHRDGDFWTDVFLMAILEDDYRAARAGHDRRDTA